MTDFPSRTRARAWDFWNEVSPLSPVAGTTVVDDDLAMAFALEKCHRSVTSVTDLRGASRSKAAAAPRRLGVFDLLQGHPLCLVAMGKVRIANVDMPAPSTGSSHAGLTAHCGRLTLCPRPCPAEPGRSERDRKGDLTGRASGLLIGGSQVRILRGPYGNPRYREG